MFKIQFTAGIISMVCLLGVASFIKAQQPASKGKFTLFFEKIYVHTDRDYYLAGDDIWFKAYVSDGQTGLPATNSANAYIELISPQGGVLNREAIRISGGMGNGDYKLNEALPAGRYQLRAYTNWMRNFGNMFFFTKDLYISAAPATAEGKAGTAGKAVAATGNTSKPVTADNRLLVFPEGGALVTGVNSRIAFKAEDAAGKGVAVKGTVVASSGKTVATVQTTYLGMGNFTLLPEEGVTYRLQAQYSNGQTVSVDLPQPLPQGLALQVTERDTAFEVGIATNAATLLSQGPMRVTVAGKHGGKFYFEDTLTLHTNRAVMLVPKQLFPEGIAAITLYDALLRPHCERLVYVNKNKAAALTLATDKTTYSPGEEVKLTVNTTEADGTVAKAHLSVAVIDAGLVPQAEGDIVSYLRLQSELRGDIEKPGAYFDRSNVKRSEQLDLLLSTQGWRDFLWRRVKDTSIVLRYLPEPGITLSGQVKNILSGRPIAGANITLTASEARGNKIYFTKTDSAGAYFLDGLPLYGSQPVRLTARDSKGNKGGMLLLDSVFGRPAPVLPLPAFSTVLPDTAAMVKVFTTEGQKRLQVLRKQQEAETHELEGVTVKNTPKTTMLTDGAYVSFGGPDSTFRITNADYKDYETLENFIIHRMPGATTDAESQGVYFLSNGQRLRPRFKVNNTEDVFERLDYYTLPMNVIEQVTIRHMLSSMMADTWIIYLTLKPEAFERKQFDLLNTTITGYYEAREFFVPRPQLNNKKADLRTTLLWKPDTHTGEGKTTVTFYNADSKTTVRVVVEGVTENGTPVAGVVNYNIK